MSVRKLATELGINPNTVQKIYRTLEVEGIVTSTNAGTFITSDIDVKAFILKQEETKIKSFIEDTKKLTISKETLLEIIDEVYEGANNDKNS